MGLLHYVHNPKQAQAPSAARGRSYFRRQLRLNKRIWIGMTTLAMALVAALALSSVALAQTPPATTPGAGQTPKAAQTPGANPAPGKGGRQGGPGLGPGADLYDGTGAGSLVAIVASKTGLTTDAVV